MDITQIRDWAFIPGLPDDTGPIRALLHTYSNIPQDEIDQHLLRIREEAWKVTKFPCIGRWKFLRLTDTSDACYRQVLFRLRLPKSRDALLDLGCCVGQALRQFHADGVDSSQLFGIDIEPRLIDIGYDLFNDRDQFKATFVIGDMADPDDKRPLQLQGMVTMIHADSFFHLFNWTQQLYIGCRLVAFLKQGTKNALIYGRQAGIKDVCSPADEIPYLHSQASFQRLWDEIGKMTRTKWKVEISFEDDIDPFPGIAIEVAAISFTIYQIA
ncbi:unnamed protein product [Clonostachys rhizophaga]|uniref:Methyltransferase domain-containing protein n=1 Tax=Clonostachys rhizophaga TaxID=160324 RepID=A0A9N9V0F6_9HYPO|nr:unnamed protein product [Clonostachys rhizophaga]